jgi:hypothetical protein
VLVELFTCPFWLTSAPLLIYALLSRTSFFPSLTQVGLRSGAALYKFYTQLRSVVRVCSVVTVLPVSKMITSGQDVVTAAVFYLFAFLAFHAQTAFFWIVCSYCSQNRISFYSSSSNEWYIPALPKIYIYTHLNVIDGSNGCWGRLPLVA